ncbi:MULTISPECIES: nuclear transport factor 2 family protein [Amycolatopsis]|uniref:Nuclear transport factor 2 family protein n=1 Tax=Amycolatopsis albidoflavus TaxID=102226 RepID=A0ABW5HTS3_9PSEU
MTRSIYRFSPLPRRELVRLAGLLMAVAFALTACQQVPPEVSRAEESAVSEADRTATVRSFYQLAFVEKKVADAADRYLGGTYVQHNPGVADGPKAFKDAFTGYFSSAPAVSYTVHRVLAEKDLVLVHAEQRGDPASPVIAIMDLFRVDSTGKIVEHWDAVQPVPGKSTNGHTMFDGPVGTRPSPSPQTREQNREAALEFLDLAFNRANAKTAVELYVADQYTQHNPRLADGGAAFVSAFAGAERLTGDAKRVFPRTIVDGNLVAVHTYGRNPDNTGSGSIDIFRFDQNNKIAEHWDAVQSYPARTASGNTVWDDGR